MSLRRKTFKDQFYHNLCTLNTFKLPRAEITSDTAPTNPYGEKGQLLYNKPTDTLWYHDGADWIELFGSSNFILSIPSDTRRLHIGESDDNGTDWDQGQPQDLVYNNILIHGPDETAFNNWLEFRASSDSGFGMQIRTASGNVLGNAATDPGFVPGNGTGQRFIISAGNGGQLGGDGGQINILAGSASVDGEKGGSALLRAGSAAGVSVSGGNAILEAGGVVGDSSKAGDAVLAAGDAWLSNDGTGGTVQIVSGRGGSVGANPAGNIELTAGDGGVGGIGGTISLMAGNSLGGVKSGDVELIAGNGTIEGGKVSIASGDGTITSGEVSLVAADTVTGTAGDVSITRGVATGAGTDGNVIFTNLPAITEFTLGIEPVAPTTVTNAAFQNVDKLSIAPSPLAFVLARYGRAVAGGNDWTLTAPDGVNFFGGNTTDTNDNIYLGVNRVYIENDTGNNIFVEDRIKIPFNCAYTYNFATIGGGGGGWSGGNPEFYDPSKWALATINIDNSVDDLTNTTWDPTPGADNIGFFKVPKAGLYRIHFILSLDMRVILSLDTDGAGVMSISSLGTTTQGPSDTFVVFIHVISRADGTVNLVDVPRTKRRIYLERQNGMTTWSNNIEFDFTDYFRAGEVFTIEIESSTSLVDPDGSFVSPIDYFGVNSYIEGETSSSVNQNTTYYYFDINGNVSTSRLDVTYLGLLQ